MILKYFLSVPIFLLIILSCSTDKIDPKQEDKSVTNKDGTPPTPKVTFFKDDELEGRDRFKVDPPKLTVRGGRKVIFASPDFDAKIGFFDSEIFKFTGWVTIKKGEYFEAIVNPLAKDTIYYAVVGKLVDGEYWYAEGNSCPAMIVER